MKKEKNIRTGEVPKKEIIPTKPCDHHLAQGDSDGPVQPILELKAKQALVLEFKLF